MYFSDGCGRARAGVWAGKQEAEDHNQSTVPDRNCCVSAGKAENARVLLRFLGSLFRSPRLRVDSDGYRWMDTDSNYIAISADRLELRAEFEATKKQWLAWDKWSGRTPGLFRLECEGSRMIALCWKCYYVDELTRQRKKEVQHQRHVEETEYHHLAVFHSGAQR